MNQNTKRLVILNLPYILTGLYTTNLGWAWRMAAGADMTEKMQSLMTVLPDALGRIIPSFHPLDCWWVYAAARGCGWRCISKAKRQEVPPRQRVRLRPMECIILSVKELYMDAQEDMHMNDYNKITAFTPAFP